MKVWRVLFVLMVLVGMVAAGDTERKILVRTDPEYPALAHRFDLHGTIKLKVWVGPDGSVRRLELVGGDPVFAESAQKR